MDPYVRLAILAVETYIKTGEIINPPDDLPQEMIKQKAGVFVSIKKIDARKREDKIDRQEDELRGCIGTFLPTKTNIAREIISNAVSAATCDPRFYPIQKEELKNLKISVDVLSEPEAIRNTKKLDPKKYGVIVRTQDGRSGLLLPNLEGVETVEHQISIACQKAGINLEHDKIFLFRFSVKRYEE